MPTNELSDAGTAELEIARRIIALSLAHSLAWSVGKNGFEAFFDDFAAFLNVTGSASRATVWTSFNVLEGEEVLVSYVYPTSYALATGKNVPPDSMKEALDDLLSTLRTELVTSRYGPALEKLRAMK